MGSKESDSTQRLSTHIYVYIYTQYTTTHEHTHSGLVLRSSILRADLEKHIHVYKYTWDADTLTHIHPESYLAHQCTHTHKLTARNSVPEVLTPTPAAIAACSLPHSWLSWGPGWAGMAWLVWLGPSLLTTLPWWQGPGKKENK